jgi:hypothetical protein
MQATTASGSPRNFLDRQLEPGQEPRIGAHLVTPRRHYTHHGMYVGGGRVIHYAGLARGLSGGPVEEVSLERFGRGRDVWIRDSRTPAFDGATVVARARSRLGERRYHVLRNNCEHFCEWCLRGENRSAQVESVKAVLRSARAAVADRLELVPRAGRQFLRAFALSTLAQ